MLKKHTNYTYASLLDIQGTWGRHSSNEAMIDHDPMRKTRVRGFEELWPWLNGFNGPSPVLCMYDIYICLFLLQKGVYIYRYI